MQPGSLAQVNFDGSINCGVDLSYGLGEFQVSAPSVAQVEKSLKNIVQITPPSLSVSAGAAASVSYTHTDHFGLLINKTASNTATLYLVRSDESDWGGSLEITVGVTVTQASVTRMCIAQCIVNLQDSRIVACDRGMMAIHAVTYYIIRLPKFRSCECEHCSHVQGCEATVSSHFHFE